MGEEVGSAAAPATRDHPFPLSRDEGTCHTHTFTSRTRARTHTHAADMQMRQLALPSATPFLFFPFFPRVSSHSLVRSSRTGLSPSFVFRRRFSSDPSIHSCFFSPCSSFHISPSDKNNVDSCSCHPLEALSSSRASLPINSLLLFFRRHRFLSSFFPGLLRIPRAILKKGEERKSHAVISVDTLGFSHARTHVGTQGKGRIRFPATGRRNTLQPKISNKKRIFCRALSSLAR